MRFIRKVAALAQSATHLFIVSLSQCLNVCDVICRDNVSFVEKFVGISKLLVGVDKKHR